MKTFNEYLNESYKKLGEKEFKTPDGRTINVVSHIRHDNEQPKAEFHHEGKHVGTVMKINDHEWVSEKEGEGSKSWVSHKDYNSAHDHMMKSV